MFGVLKVGEAVKNRTKVSAGKRLPASLDRSREAVLAYETLVTNLQVLGASQPLKSILVTSSQPGEGKTTVTVNLAVALALAGKSVLIVDADLRKPRIHEVLGLENNRGTVELLAGNMNVAEIDELPRIVELDIAPGYNQKNLEVIPSGAVPSDFSAAGFQKLRGALDYYRTRYDVTLIDSPPVFCVNDPVLLAPLVDGVILILNSGVVTENDVRRAKVRLEQAGGRILGVVMNGFDEKLHGPGFHPYHAYYQ